VKDPDNSKAACKGRFFFCRFAWSITPARR
jgi:hypothetical protein